MTLDEVIKVTSRRVNALEHVVIPKIEGNIHFIKKVLDEQAREDFYRQKKLTDKKKNLEEETELEREAEGEEEIHEAGTVAETFQAEDDEDKDVIF